MSANAGFVVLAKIPTARDAALAHGFVAECRHGGIASVDLFDFCDLDQHIDDGFGVDGRDRCAANVMDGSNVRSQSL